ncbi:uncharacterized protein LDX57_008765 [Aspergillus melleus]|uniref:uncharacterized protein n=1 Tax=Aspergillus melleus TaxID=138277 RepID=UPI001E8D100D|nr:uncharacterized protein LDX57_008765 [Aspergillus melleus]KAH8431104.1 hypothetical protein LDX57_008765 [Aspergillus melleus]
MKLSALFSAAISAGLGGAIVINGNLVQNSVGCASENFDSAHILAAANQARVLHNAGRKVGPYPGNDPRNYPHYFGNLNGNQPAIPLSRDCVGVGLEEFPLVRSSNPYNGGTPGVQRVVVSYEPNANDVRYALGLCISVSSTGRTNYGIYI